MKNIKNIVKNFKSIPNMPKMIIKIIAFCIIIYPSPIFANLMDSKDLHGILSNIRSIFPPLTKAILAICFVGGITFFMKGAWMLHNFGQMQNQLQRPSSIASPFIYILIGAMLIYLPSSTNIFSATFFRNSFNNIFGKGTSAEVIVLEQNNGPLGENLQVKNSISFEEKGGVELMQYVELGVGVGLEWADLMNTVIMFIQFVGFVAFVRGWFIISHIADPNAQQGNFSKGIIHLIGGIISINFVPFIKAIASLATGSRTY